MVGFPIAIKIRHGNKKTNVRYIFIDSRVAGFYREAKRTAIFMAQRKIHLMGTLYLIRHGQASFGAADYDDLSELGRRQGRVLGRFLADAGIRFDECWSGALRRQRQTAAETAESYRQAGVAMPRPSENPVLDEYDYETVLRTLIPIVLEEDPAFGKAVDGMLADRRVFQQVFGRVMMRWASGHDHLAALPSWEGFCRRTAAGIQDMLTDCPGGSRVAVFTSGGPIAAMVGRVLGLAPETAIALSWQLVNASITRFKFSRGRIGLDTFNEKGHLAPPAGDGLVTYR